MTLRQARTERRAAERKAKKAEIRRNKQAGIDLHDVPLEQEFSAELIAEANAMRDRVHRRAAALKLPTFNASPDCSFGNTPNRNPDCKGGAAGTGFVPQTTSRAEINRANAQHSTGPVTIHGKLASSRNSLKHGLASGQVIIAGEDPTAFESLLTELLKEHQPATSTEELLIQEMAQSYWLTQRALRLQNECFTAEGVDEKRLSLFLRYHTTHQRSFHKALSTLMKIKKEHARGFVSQRAVPTALPTEFVRKNEHPAAEKTGFVSQNPLDSGNPAARAA